MIAREATSGDQGMDFTRIGCSDLPVVVRRDPFRERVDLWLRIVHALDATPSPYVEEAGDMGKRLEHAVALAGCERILQIDAPLFRPMSLTPSSRDWQRYSLDFVAGVVDFGGELRQVAAPRLIECKVRSKWSLEAAGGWGRSGTPEVGARELVQVQGQLEALRADRDSWLGTDVPDIAHVDLIVLVDGQHLQHHPVPYDAELAGLVREEAERFWTDFVLTKTPPPFEYLEGTARELRRRHAILAGEISAPPEAHELAIRLAAIREQRKEIEEQEEQLHLQLAEIAAGAQRMRGDGWLWSHGDQEGSLRWGALLEDLRVRAGLDMAAFSALKNDFRGADKRVPRLTVQNRKSKA